MWLATSLRNSCCNDIKASACASVLMMSPQSYWPGKIGPSLTTPRRTIKFHTPCLAASTCCRSSRGRSRAYPERIEFEKNALNSKLRNNKSNRNRNTRRARNATVTSWAAKNHGAQRTSVTERAEKKLNSEYTCYWDFKRNSNTTLGRCNHHHHWTRQLLCASVWCWNV